MLALMLSIKECRVYRAPCRPCWGGRGARVCNTDEILSRIGISSKRAYVWEGFPESWRGNVPGVAAHCKCAFMCVRSINRTCRHFVGEHE